MIYRFLYKLEQKVAKLSIQNLMTVLTVSMTIVYIADLFIMPNLADRLLYQIFMFDRAAIFRGEVWRIISFLFLYPFNSNFILVLLSLYFYWWIGDMLESIMGSTRFNTYYFIGIIVTIIAGFITGYTTNMYLNYTLFLALAFLYPSMQLRIYFIIPIQIKYIAIFHVITNIVMVIVFTAIGDFSYAVAIIVSHVNYLMYYGGSTWNTLKRKIREWRYLHRK